MSAPRPRPVTADSYVSNPMRVPYRSSDLRFSDSDGSTQSLVSVLDHLSCGSNDYTDEYPAQSNDKHLKRSQSEQCASNEPFVTPPRTRKVNNKNANNSNNCNVVRESGDGLMSPWEKWVLEKEKTKRQMIKKKLTLKQVEVEKRIQAEQEKLQHLAKSTRVYEDWVQKKHQDQEKKEVRRRRKQEKKEKEEQAKKEEIAAKAEKKYQEWMEQKKAEQRKKEAAERKEKEAAEEEKANREKESKEAFDRWKVEAAKRSGYSEAGGRLQGPFACMLSPEPSYCNPIPWKPIHVPNQVERKPRGARARGGRTKKRPPRPRNCWDSNGLF